MEIETFVAKSQGEWVSMRSGHSLAFKQFEEVISTIKIKQIPKEDSKVIDFLKKNGYSERETPSPFEIFWEGESNWDGNDDTLSGSSLLIPIPNSNNEGIILRSAGYAEKGSAISKYKFLSDHTFVLSTEYEQIIAEERIWFINSNTRCRSSVLFSKESKGILQTSFASEIRIINE
ncbi:MULTISPECIES: phycobiliprotein lyase [unclassified Prochlorococcus]|uniref:phycobiliprotein lyase n=1 Tax=unclassified Prochlorococcus TaxID=2627481 RepID=UPI000533B4FC|nr:MULTISPECIES: phycobiliprotein lyase [unclassified Prochlorococcus]KGG16616.1 Phycoerythrin linker protein CpeS-like [Prochlorococcus sp. MIT 0602]KGG18412.1 Phycoerythrin linker protein CpeS-like [Prochlorococcus sp. MIT 0603]